MAINPITGKSGTVAFATHQAKKEGRTEGGGLNSTSTQQDAIDVAQSLKQALQSASSTPVVDQSKIDAVKQALQSGNYEIDADRIAEKMLQFDRPFDST